MKLNHTQTNINLKLDKLRCFVERKESFDQNNLFRWNEKWVTVFFYKSWFKPIFVIHENLTLIFFSNLAREAAGYCAGGLGSILASLEKFLNQVSLALGGGIKMDQAR